VAKHFKAHLFKKNQVSPSFQGLKIAAKRANIRNFFGEKDRKTKHNKDHSIQHSHNIFQEEHEYKAI
jgi:hypothetical protein